MSNDYTPENINSGFQSQTSINTNLTKIAEGIEKQLSRTTSTDNAMEVDLDMNGKSILNVKGLAVDGLTNKDGVPYVVEDPAAQALKTGDSLITVRKLDADVNMKQELKLFDRLANQEFDDMLGAYVNPDNDFENYTSTDLYLPKAQTEAPHPSTGTLNESNNVIFRSNGFFNTFYFTLRSDELILIDKSDMTVAHTITPAVGTRFVTAGVVGTKLLIWVEVIGVTTSGKIYQLLEDFTDVTEAMTIPNLRSGHQPFSWDKSTILDAVDEDYFYICLDIYAFQALGYEIVSVLRVAKDYSEHAKTVFKHDVSISGTDIQDKPYYLFYNKEEKQLRGLYTSKSATSIEPPMYAAFPDSLMNKVNGTLVATTLQPIYSKRLGKVKTNLLATGATGLSSYSTLPETSFIFNARKNEIISTGNFSTVGATVAFEQILYVSYDATSGKVKNIIFQNELEDFIGESNVNFGNFNTEGGVISSLSQFGVNESVEVNIGNKVYQPIIWNTGTKQGMIFVNTDDGIDIIKDRPHSVDTSSGATYAFCPHKILSDEENVIYFTDGRGDNSNDNRTIRKLSMIDPIITSPFRPTPYIGAIAPAKGYWKIN